MERVMWDGDTVLMPVPLRWAPQVADFLAALRSGRESITPDTIELEQSVAVPGQGQWTREMVVELVENTPYIGVLALLDRCAEEPEVWILKSVVEERNSISAIQLRNELGALSKLTKRIFGTSKPSWPMQWKKEQGKYYYRLDRVVAAWWLEARGLA